MVCVCLLRLKSYRQISMNFWEMLKSSTRKECFDFGGDPDACLDPVIFNKGLYINTLISLLGLGSGIYS